MNLCHFLVGLWIKRIVTNREDRNCLGSQDRASAMAGFSTYGDPEGSRQLHDFCAAVAHAKTTVKRIHDIVTTALKGDTVKNATWTFFFELRLDWNADRNPWMIMKNREYFKCLEHSLTGSKSSGGHLQITARLTRNVLCLSMYSWLQTTWQRYWSTAC